MLLQKFSFTETQNVTTLVHPAHGILFDATNVCSILELRDTTSALRRLDDDEKALLKREEYERFPDSASEAESEFDRQKGAKSKWFVTEPGLYTLTLGSEKPQARTFKRWITHEVIPALRRTGSYTMHPSGATQAVPSDLSPLVQMAMALKVLPMSIVKQEMDACKAIFQDFTDITGNHLLLAANNLFKQTYQIDMLKTADVTLPSRVQKCCLCPTDLGLPLGLSAIKMNSILEMAGLQTSGQDHHGHKVWEVTPEGEPYCEYVDTGKAHSNGAPIQQIKWYASVLEHETVKQLLDIATRTKNKHKAKEPAKEDQMTLTPSERLEKLKREELEKGDTPL